MSYYDDHNEKMGPAGNSLLDPQQEFKDRFAAKLRSVLPSLWANPNSLPEHCTVYACSDLHIDMHANKKWLEALPVCPEAHNVLIVAGDVQSSVEKLEVRCPAPCP